jgi:Ca2+-transporting ATPase
MAVLHKSGIEVLPGETLSGTELAQLSAEASQQQVETTKLFYRISPQQKLDIVKALQANGHIVAMMGDGINDTPALKKAEIGIVVENATSFSKEVADMILLDSNFRTIIDAVAEGRNIFEKVRKMVAYLLIDAFDAVILVVGALLLGLPSPLQPLQILYINIVADGLPDLGLAFDPSEPDLMNDRPLPKNTPIIDSRTRILIGAVGFVIMGTVLLFYQQFYDAGDLEFTARLQTSIFAVVGLNSLFYVFSVRSLRTNLWKQNFLNNKFLLLGVFFGIIFMLAAIYLPPLQTYLYTVPLPANYWVWISAVVALDLCLFELVKYVFIKLKK